MHQNEIFEIALSHQTNKFNINLALRARSRLALRARSRHEKIISLHVVFESRHT